MLNGLITAFSMYSKLPMPRVDFNSDNMKYAICFFPLVGLVQGFIFVALCIFCEMHSIPSIIFAALATVLPIAINGAIHMDGLCDTIDALASNQSKERKLEILKDPNAGAFAVIGCVLYFLLYFAFFTQFELSRDLVITFALSYMFIRSLSGFSITSFKCAKSSGLAFMFSDATAKNTALAVFIIYICIVSAIMLAVNVYYALAVIFVSALCFFHYKVMSYREFGGITGDLAGYFLQISELCVLMALVIINLI